MKTWFTADTHFGHENIIKYCDRPFKSLHRMNQVLTKNWNSRIKPDDLVIFLGDFCFRGKSKAEKYLSKLNGHITFVKGNHDSNNSLNTKILSLIIILGNQTFYCVHDPANANLKFKYNLVGHVHQNWKIQKRKNTMLINVGVDVWKYAPVSISEILALL